MKGQVKNLEKVIQGALRYAKSFENNGKVAGYIPQLATADKNALGIAIAANNKKL